MKTFATSIAEDFGNGGVIDGDITISGDLTVEGSSTNGTYDEIIQGALQITAASAFIDVTDTDSSLNVKIASGDSIGSIGTSTNHPLSIRTNNANAMTIDSSGRVVIGHTANVALGTTDPSLQVLGTSEDASQISIGRFSADDTAPKINLIKGRGGIGANTIVTDNDNLGTINFRGADGSDLDTIGASIEARVNGTPGANDLPAELLFSTTADGAATPTTRMTITSAGLIGMPSTTAGVALNLTGKIRISDKIEVNGNNFIIQTATVTDIDGGSDSAHMGFLNAASSGDSHRGFTFNAANTAFQIEGQGNLVFKSTAASGADVGDGASLYLQKDDGQAMANNDVLGEIIFQGAEDSSNNLITGARIFAHNSRGSAWDASNNHCDLVFATTTGNNTLATRMSITDDGHLVPGADGTQNIGTTSSQDWGTLFIRQIDMANSLFILETASSAVRYSDHSSVGNGHIFLHRNAEAMRIGVSDSAALTTTFSGDVQVTSATRSSITKTSSATNTTNGALALQHQTSGDMVDNFGASLDFQIKDSAGSTNTIAKVAGVRDGGDAQGALTFNALFGGTMTERMRITTTGDVHFGSDNYDPLIQDGSGVAAGSVGYSFKADTDTGMTSGASSNVLMLVTGGSAAMVLTPTSRICLSNNDNNTSNTVFGKKAFVQGADGTTVIGDVGADYNVAIGEGAMGGDRTSSNFQMNVGIGFGSLRNLTTGDYNVSIGHLSSGSLTTGEKNNVIGREAFATSQAGVSNIAIGHQALAAVNHTSNDGSIAIGELALGSKNLASGDQFTGATVAIGHTALTALTSGVGNTAVGYKALFTEDDGNKCVAIGYEALMTQGGRTGDLMNTAVGYQAAKLITQSQGIVAIGHLALAGGDSYAGNVAIGNKSMSASQSGAYNVGVGESSLLNVNVNGWRNTAVGHNAGDLTTSGTDNTILGYETDADTATTSNQTVIGCAGIFKFVSKEYTCDHASNDDNDVASSEASPLKIPARAVIKSVSAIASQLSNLGTYELAVFYSDDTASPSDDAGLTNGVELIGAGNATTNSGGSGNAIDIEGGSGATLEKAYYNGFDGNGKHVGTGDRYIHIVNAGTGNGDTDPSTAAKIKVLVEYVGME